MLVWAVPLAFPFSLLRGHLGLGAQSFCKVGWLLVVVADDTPTVGERAGAAPTLFAFCLSPSAAEQREAAAD
jgi:hypothetical protein